MNTLDHHWNFVLVEDNLTVRQEVKDFLDGENFPFGAVKLSTVDNFDEALPLLEERKVDLLILDVRGDQDQDRTAGIRVLEQWKSAGFSPVIFYTALPESVREYESLLIKVVAKDQGLTRLLDVIHEFFDLRIPQTHRAIVRHVDASLRDYMWGFVLQNWTTLQEFVQKPDFVRLLLRRLAAQLSRSGIGRIIDSLYPDAAEEELGEEVIHPTEYYIKPPIGTDPQMGDIRVIEGLLYVVVWPSCDMVSRGGICKVERALCARARPLDEFDEHKQWIDTPTKPKREALAALMKNNKRGGQAERYHFLPPAWDIPSSVVDFQDLRHEDVSVLRSVECRATIASPFAESIGTRFIRYLGRLGTPDLDIEAIIGTMERKN